MIKKLLREPLFYLLPLLAIVYLMIIPAHLEISGRIGPPSGFKALSLMHYIFALLFLLSVALILRKVKFKFIAISIILLGIIIRLILYAYSDPMLNVHDIDTHFYYMQVIAEEKRLPKIGEYRNTNHPPLYYIASAAIKSISDRYAPNLTNRILQQFSLLLSFSCIIFGVAFLINSFGNNRAAYSAALIFVFWPGFILTAPRINNDILFYFGALFCMLFAQRYWCSRKNFDVVFASIGASIALAAKSTGFVILGVWVMIYALNALRFLKINSLRTLFASMSIIILSVVLSNYRIIADILEDGKKPVLADVRNSHWLDALKVQNTVGNYLYFDLQDYLLEPYTSPWEDKGGRQYFWNFALKTSLFGEFRLWDMPVGRIFAAILSILALLIWIFALWGMMHFQVKELPSLFFIGFLFAALIFLRVSYPYACSNDFRYIMPVLLPLSCFAIRGIQILQNLRLRILAGGGIVLFAGLSFLFMFLRGFYV